MSGLAVSAVGGAWWTFGYVAATRGLIEFKPERLKLIGRRRAGAGKCAGIDGFKAA